MNEKELHIRIPIRRVVDAAGTFIAAAILFIGANYALATTPNPGHPWTDVGNGFWQASNSQTALRTFTFPDADATVLTSNTAVTVPQGGTGWTAIQSGTIPYGNGSSAFSTTSAGTAGTVLALLNGIPTWVATTTLATISGTLPLTGGGTNASLTASNGGIVYSGSSALAILAGNGTAGKILQSGASAAPTWSTATYPATVGTAGQVLMSNGTNWVSAATSTAGLFVNRQVLTSGTTYTPTAGTNTVVLQMCGGGGGGSGATGAATPTTSVGGGGGSGSYAEKRFTNISGAASYTVAIGAAGTAGVAANGAGGAGGNTTFACPSTCTGGALTVTAIGGSGAPATTAAGTSILSSLGGAGGTVATNGDLNTVGQPGGYSVRFSGNTGVSGAGGASHFGGGGNARNTAGVGNAGGNFCAGGGGAMSISASGNAGGAGTVGVIVVWEYK